MAKKDEDDHNFLTDGLRFSPADFLTEGIDTSRAPLFTVGEVSKFFFAKSADWVRWRERKGEVSGDRRFDNGSRAYSLTDVERMVHDLARRGSITGPQAGAAISLVAGQMILWGYHCVHQNPTATCETCWVEQRIEQGDFA